MWCLFCCFAEQISDHIRGGGYDYSVSDTCFSGFVDRDFVRRIINLEFGVSTVLTFFCHVDFIYFF